MRNSAAVLACVGLALGAAHLETNAAATLQGTQLNATRSTTTTSGSLAAGVPEPRAFLNRYCVTCHNQKVRAAQLALETISVERVGDAADLWEKVVRKLRTDTMPPAGSPRPDQATSRAFVAWLESELDGDAATRPNPGRPASVHRLNRVEYANAIRDLLALEVDARSTLPADDSDHGFDNVADVLTVSPLLLQGYMSAAQRISQLAIGDSRIRPAFESYSVPKSLVQDDRMSEELPFGSRGGLAIRHRFPVNGEYVVKIRLQRNYVDYVRGLGEAHHLDVRLDGARIERLTVGGEQKGRPSPASFAGNIFGDPEWEQYAHSADARLEVRFAAKAGTRVVGVAFERKAGEPEGVLQPRPTAFAFAVNEDPLGNPAVESIAIGGPFGPGGAGDTASHRRVFICRPAPDARDEERCAEKILAALAQRAFRRPVIATDMQQLLGFYRSGRREGSFESGVQAAVERILVDPEFLFRIERDPPGVPPATAYQLDDLALASRLAFFLWSSIPDDELREVAAQGRLKDPAVLERQVRRMLADPRSAALVTNFAGQWLLLRNVGGVSPDTDTFPDFDENLRTALQRETELFVESQLREDRSVTGLLNADYTFLNDRLARHYGIADVYGSHFRRVTLTDANRRGLLGQGSLLMVTSYANRTSPVLRGRWLLENVLGTPPPAPPPNVPSLPDRGEDGTPRSLRERMEQHRKSPVCATCHRVMDPLGFALENFDAIGRWRSLNEAGTPVDVSGAFPDGTTFEGPAGLRALLLRRPEVFVETFTEKLLTYAVGRGVESYDRPAIRRILREAGPEFRWSAIILGIVKSTPFQQRRSAS